MTPNYGTASDAVTDHKINYSEKRQENTKLLQGSKDSTRCYIPARFVLAFWSSLGFVNMFTTRMDLNIAILAMVSKENATNMVIMKNETTTPVTPSQNQTYKFHWSSTQQVMALSVFYYGYSSTQILGGYLSRRIGSKLILGNGLLITSLLSLLTPIAAMQSYYLLLACRVVQGLCQGLAQPCMHTMWSNWAPEREISILMTITYSGSQLGTMAATLMSGYICNTDILGGWPLLFYIFGGCGVAWSVLWLLLVHEKPEQHPRISDQELKYIEDNIMRLPETFEPIKPPWSRILRSPALLAIIAAHFANDWGCFALTTCLPSYLHHVLKYDITQNGFLSALPFLVLLFTNPASGYLADKLRSKNILSTKNTRKLTNSIGLFLPCLFMLFVCFLDSDRTVTIVLLTLAVGISGFTMAGYSVNHLDIAPNFAGILFGITNTIGTTTGFIGPAILAALTGDNEGSSETRWNIFFYLTAGLFFMGGLMFLLFAQGEPQSWGMPVQLQNVVANENVTRECCPGHQEQSDSSKSISHARPVGRPSQDSDYASDEDEFDEVYWESLIAHRQAELQQRQTHFTSFSQMLQSF